jgi:hypothetical protein
MLTAIHFDHQLVFGTGEVYDEIAQRMLSPEFVFHQASIAQSRPDPAFRIGRGLPQSAGFLVGHHPIVSAIRK